MIVLNATKEHFRTLGLPESYLVQLSVPAGKRNAFSFPWRHDGLMVSVLVSGSRGLGSSPCRRHCVVFSCKTLYCPLLPLIEERDRPGWGGCETDVFDLLGSSMTQKSLLASSRKALRDDPNNGCGED